jgi:hypothetical protein
MLTGSGPGAVVLIANTVHGIEESTTFVQQTSEAMWETGKTESFSHFAKGACIEFIQTFRRSLILLVEET